MVYKLIMREQNSRKTILNSATKLFADKGYEAVSVNDIVEMSQVTKPTLYYFFDSKEGLLEELLKTNFAKLNSLLEEACHYQPDLKNYEKDVFPVLLKTVHTFFAFAKENTEFYLMALSFTFAPPASKPGILSEKYLKEHYILLEKMFCDMSSAHGNIKGKERILSWRFIAMINSHIAFWHRGYAELDDIAVRSIVTCFMHGIFS